MASFSWISDIIADEVEYGLRRALSPVGPFLRMLLSGAVLIGLSLWGFAACLTMLGLAAFFGFGHLPYVAAALWTALLFGVIAIIFMLLGMIRLRRPH